MDTTYNTHIEQIVQSIFTSMLGMEAALDTQDPVNCREAVIGTIQVAGDHAVTVVLGMSEGAARASAAAMLQMKLEDVAIEDERDVVAELTNMIGGNFKSLLPGHLYLSLPTVVDGREMGLQVPGAELVEDVGLACEAGAFRVRLYTRPNANP